MKLCFQPNRTSGARHCQVRSSAYFVPESAHPASPTSCGRRGRFVLAYAHHALTPFKGEIHVDNSDSSKQSKAREQEPGQFTTGLAVNSTADTEHFRIAFVTLLNHLVLDKKVRQLFNAWNERTGIPKVAVRISQLLDECANLLHLDSTEPLLHDGFFQTGIDLGNLGIMVSTESDSDHIEKLISELNMTIQEFNQLGYQVDRQRMVDDAILLLRNEKAKNISSILPLIVAGLIYRWENEMRGIATNRLVVDVFTITPIPPAAPPISVHFETDPNEDIFQSLRRYQQQYKEVYEKLKAAQEAPSIPKGKVTRKETLEKYVEWFYRFYFSGESKNAIAKKDFPDKIDHRRRVTYGIRKIEEIFKLVHYVPIPW